MFRPPVTLLAFSVGLGFAGGETFSNDLPWARHVIDNSSRGADGVKLGHLD